MKRLVREVMSLNSIQDFIAVQVSDPVEKVVQTMDQQQVGATLIFNGPRIAGIFSERDLVRITGQLGSSALRLPIGQVATRFVYYVTPDQTLEDCLHLMTELNVRHLPIFENERPVGMISQQQIIGLILPDKQHQIDQLTSYITGSPMTNSNKTSHQNPKRRLTPIFACG